MHWGNAIIQVGLIHSVHAISRSLSPRPCLCQHFSSFANASGISSIIGWLALTAITSVINSANIMFPHLTENNT